MHARLYRSLYRIRRVEEEIARIYATDKIKSPVHLSIGQEAVSVPSFPALDPKCQVSQQGGTTPHWSRDGRELVFVAADVRVFAASLTPQGDDLNPGVPRLLFTSPRALLAFAPSPDHARFLSAVLPAGRIQPPLHLLLNWKGL